MDPHVKKALHGKISGLLKSMASKRVASKFGAAPVEGEEDASQEVESPAEELGETPDEGAAEGDSSGITDEEREMLQRLYSKLG